METKCFHRNLGGDYVFLEKNWWRLSVSIENLLETRFSIEILVETKFFYRKLSEDYFFSVGNLMDSVKFAMWRLIFANKNLVETYNFLCRQYFPR